jgi:hypothetical protein
MCSWSEARLYTGQDPAVVREKMMAHPAPRVFAMLEVLQTPDDRGHQPAVDQDTNQADVPAAGDRS